MISASRAAAATPFSLSGAGVAMVVALLLAGCGPNRQKAMALADQAQQQLDAGDPRQASLTIDRAIREQDDVADLYLLKARIALAANRPGDVLQAFAQAAELEPNNIDALRGLAQVSLQAGRTDDAEHAVNQLLAQNPADAIGRLVKGLIALTRCLPEPALDLAGQILANNPMDEGGMVLKARALFALRRDSEAKAMLDDGIKRYPNSFGLLLTRLEMDRSAGDATAIKADFAALRRLQPRNGDIALQHINMLYKSGDLSGARREGLGLLRTGMAQGDVLDGLARLWREYDAAPLSPSELADLATRGPRPSRITAAQHYLEVSQGAPALTLLTGLDGSDAAGLVTRAHLLLGQGSEAQAAARQVLEQDKTQCDAMLTLAGAELSAGHREDAAGRAEQAAAECPRQWLAYVIMADANAGSEAQLDRVTAAALEADPQNGALARALAARWLARGQADHAVAIARRATRAAPALVSGWILLQETCTRARDALCTGEAGRGLAQARRHYAIDPLPGQPSPMGGGETGCRRPASHEADQVRRKRSSTVAI